MFVVLRSYPDSSIIRRGGIGIGLLTTGALIALGGCSANITRFDSPYFALSDGSGPPASATSSPSAGAPIVDQPSDYASAPAVNAPSPGRSSVEVAALPSADLPPRPVQPAQAAQQPAAPYRTAASRPLPPPAIEKGAAIEVQRGDTIYGLSRRHHVTISELMSVNELKSPMIRPGQKLYLPAGIQSGGQPSGPVVANADHGTPSTAVRNIRPSRPAPIAAARPIAPTAGDWSGSYTIQPGDSLYVIAARHRIKYRDLQRVNRITDVRKIRPGTVIKVPGDGRSAATELRTAEITHGASRAAAASPTPTRISAQTAEPVAPPSRVSGVKVLNADQPPRPVTAVERREEKVAAAPRIAPSAAPAGQSHATKLRWPVKGRIVQGFGPRVDGGHNDGVDVSVPMGTDVLAAEDGVVAYAGGEVKTYGNLVLVRHQNGLVTAYAYNDKILVQRGDRVKRGQPIAKAGKTGSTDRPQLHFEVRVGAKPVDPVPYLERM